ncbi:ABC transporter permease [Algoriphagus chordae]|uniref:Putative ABC transport system permease protein n=1 Tax=Algoriphagus chordae TaxID=237019 RepID=A0A2W7QVW3_9BACT|nr:ABC transporter permease [Algoriphagus chordae]PZX51326.1 putative ABC transport system permease protein [Algoriphagus chordae]
MWRNIIKISLRNLKKHKSLTVINVLGMAVGLAACLLIGLFIFDELAYDQNIKDGDRIYRVALETSESGWAGSPGPLAEGLKNDFAEVESSTRIMKFPELDQMLLKRESNGEITQFYETKGYYVDSTFLDVIDYELVSGVPSTALKAPNSVVLSASLAKKFFGEADPLNQPITIGLPFGDFDYTITGVFEDKNRQSHIDANFFLSMENNDIGNAVKRMTSWAANNIFYTYVKLKPNTESTVFEAKLPGFFDKHGAADLKAMGVEKSLFLQPIKDIYLHSNVEYELGTTGNITTLYVFGSVAGFILLIACINFMNLATARSEKRSKEVGIRKLLGANKSGLVRQFLGESMLISLLGLIIAFLLASLLMPYFNQLTGKELDLYQDTYPLIAIFLLAIAAGLLAGTYPAFFLSAFTPSSVLKGKFRGKLSGFSLRQVLVVFQFAISACLILMVFVIKNQLSFVQSQDLGFSKDQQLIIPLQSEEAAGKYEILKAGLLQNTNVNSVTIATTYPGIESIESMMYYADGQPKDRLVNITNAYVGDDYLETLGFTLLEGRSFTQDYTSEYPMMILNEAAVKALGYQVADVVGKKANFDWRGKLNSLEIVGVVKDFNFQSLHKEIQPYAFIKGNNGGYLIANFSGTNTNDVLANAESVWQKSDLSEPFVYSFLDQDFQRNYEKEERIGNIIIAFAMLAIFIACLGLYGLTAFMTEQRTKEIGIRKTMGASNWRIVTLLSRDFGKTVLLAILLSVPLSLYLSNAWLENFAFKIELKWWYFVLTGLVALMIAMITVSFQSIRTALMNPVESLKSE